METQTPNTPDQAKNDKFSDRKLAGIFLLGIGGVLLADRVGADLPHWLFTWQMTAIVVGLFIGAKHRFRDWGWLMPVSVGVVFLANEFVEGFSIDQFFWPIIIIAFGLTMILSRRHHRHRCG
jgi:hypothetical protein